MSLLFLIKQVEIMMKVVIINDVKEIIDNIPYFELADYRVLCVGNLDELENYNHYNKKCKLTSGEKRTMIIGMESVDYIIAIDTRNINQATLK